MKFIFLLAVALQVLATTGSHADDLTKSQEKVYGTPSEASICVTVSSAFQESGKHYIPAGTKFVDLLKSIHDRKGLDPWHSIKLIRDNKCVCNTIWADYHRENPSDPAAAQMAQKLNDFQLKDGDIIENGWFNW